MLPVVAAGALQHRYTVTGWGNLGWPEVGEFDRPTGEPFGGRGARDVEDLRRLAVGQPGVLELLAVFRGGTGLRMTARARVLDGSSAVLGWFCDRGAKSAINPSSIALARNKGQLRRGI
jgi:hypothetical protein